MNIDKHKKSQNKFGSIKISVIYLQHNQKQ